MTLPQLTVTSSKALAGLVVPVVTPFTKFGGIDTRAFTQHLEFLARGGVKRLIVGGTTGEGCPMSMLCC